MSLSPDVEQRIREILARLSTLSEVSAASIGHTSPSSDRDQQLPRGLYEGARRTDRPPSKDHDLFGFYLFHFARVKSDQEAQLWVYLAEIDLAARTHRLPDQRAAGTQGIARESAEDRDKRILEWYEGLGPLQAAIAESHHGSYTREENVRKVRREARRDPETGRKLAGWAGWSDEERTKAVNNLKLTKGWGKARIAQELGCSEGSVQRYLGGYRRRVA